MFSRAKGKLKDFLQDGRRGEPPESFSVQSLGGKSLADIQTNPQKEAAEGVRECWNRTVEKLVTQLGKDLPRFANKIIFTTTKDNKIMEEAFNEMTQRKSFVLATPKLSEEVEDIYSIHGHEDTQNLNQKRLHELKTILLLLSHFLEKMKRDSPSFCYIEENFDEFFSHSVDLSSECAYFLEKAFVPSGEQTFPVQSASLNVMRTLTQGHFSSVTTGFQSRLGITNITGNMHHQIFVVLPEENDDSIYVAHYKAEASSWGHMKWMLGTRISSCGAELKEIDFSIYELALDVSAQLGCSILLIITGWNK